MKCSNIKLSKMRCIYGPFMCHPIFPWNAAEVRTLVTILSLFDAPSLLISQFVQKFPPLER